MLTAVIRAEIVGRLEAKVSAQIAGGGGEHETYRGVYNVRPEWYAQELETENKLMLRNAHVESIQMSEVSNPAGGMTLSI